MPSFVTKTVEEVPQEPGVLTGYDEEDMSPVKKTATRTPKTPRTPKYATDAATPTTANTEMKFQTIDGNLRRPHEGRWRLAPLSTLWTSPHYCEFWWATDQTKTMTSHHTSKNAAGSLSGFASDP